MSEYQDHRKLLADIVGMVERLCQSDKIGDEVKRIIAIHYAYVNAKDFLEMESLCSHGVPKDDDCDACLRDFQNFL